MTRGGRLACTRRAWPAEVLRARPRPRITGAQILGFGVVGVSRASLFHDDLIGPSGVAEHPEPRRHALEARGLGAAARGRRGRARLTRLHVQPQQARPDLRGRAKGGAGRRFRGNISVNRAAEGAMRRRLCAQQDGRSNTPSSRPPPPAPARRPPGPPARAAPRTRRYIFTCEPLHPRQNSSDTNLIWTLAFLLVSLGGMWNMASSLGAYLRAPST